MKNAFILAAISYFMLLSVNTMAQSDKSKRPSPPASVTQTLKSGAVVTIDYSQPSLKGRTIGKDVEPEKGKVWRMGANEATVFSVTKDVMVEGKMLPAGKYSLWGIMGDNDYTLIFNSAYNVWGTTYDQNKAKDVLQVKVKPVMGSTSTEKLSYTIDASGVVTLHWGTLSIPFKVS